MLLASKTQKLKEKEEEIKRKDDELKRFEEVENIKKLTYAELSSLNHYVNKTYSDAIEQRENKVKKPEPEPKQLAQEYENQNKKIDKKFKIR